MKRRQSEVLPRVGNARLSQLLMILPWDKTTLWTKCVSGEFPAPIRVSPKIVWRCEDVWAWIEWAQGKEENRHSKVVPIVPLLEADLPVRAYNALRAEGIEDLADVPDEKELLKMVNLGKVSVSRILEAVERFRPQIAAGKSARRAEEEQHHLERLADAMAGWVSENA